MEEKFDLLGYKKISQNCYCKAVKKINEYYGMNFKTILFIGFFIVLNSERTEIIDGYARPLEPFELRTEKDLESFNNLMGEFQNDLDILQNQNQDQDQEFDA